MNDELIQQLLSQNKLLLEKVKELESKLNKTDLKATVACPLISNEERVEAANAYNKMIEVEKTEAENKSMFL